MHLYRPVDPFGPNQEIDVAAGEVWYAPGNQINILNTTALKQIPVENNSYGVFHDLGTISRSTNEPALWTQIAAENQRVGVVPRPQIPLFEARAIEFEPADVTHEDYLQ